MPEDLYRQFKDDQNSIDPERPKPGALSNIGKMVLGSNDLGIPDRPKQMTIRVRDVRFRKVVARVGQSQRPVGSEYVIWKADLAAAVQDIKSEICEQHQLTRGEVQSSRRDILAAVKSSPAEYVKVLCEFGLVALVFALLVRITLKIELVNTAFALFMIFSLGFYWVMAQVKQASDKKRDRQP